MQHLKENRMTYLEHLGFAVGHGVAAIVFGVGLIIHGIVPPLFANSGRFLSLRLEDDFGDRDPVEYR